MPVGELWNPASNLRSAAANASWAFWLSVTSCPSTQPAMITPVVVAQRKDLRPEDARVLRTFDRERLRLARERGAVQRFEKFGAVGRHDIAEPEAFYLVGFPTLRREAFAFGDPEPQLVVEDQDDATGNRAKDLAVQREEVDELLRFLVHRTCLLHSRAATPPRHGFTHHGRRSQLRPRGTR